jgi:branched-chain amino acid transport system ATP-binding protein
MTNVSEAICLKRGKAMLLEFKEVEVLYNNIILALRRVSIDVPEGGIVSILGANGAGKSTILKAISGILALENGKISKGNIFFEGKRIDDRGPAELARSGISQVMEGRELFRSLSVEENLKVGTLMRKESKKQLLAETEMIYQFFPRLKERRRQISGTLSGGEQQMLVIAMSLMTKPKLLLLDEPSLGLAPLMAETVIEEVKKINERLKTTILLVEQNAALSLPISHYAYIITNGRVALKAEAKEILEMDISKYYLGGD